MEVCGPAVGFGSAGILASPPSHLPLSSQWPLLARARKLGHLLSWVAARQHPSEQRA